MAVTTVYCDHCASDLLGRQQIPITMLPVSIASANAGESAILCKRCFWFIENHPLYLRYNYKESSHV